jgi:site-specific recombinase XerD
MEKRKARIITTKLAMEWATLPPDRHASWALRLSDVRGFARHVANFDPRTEVSPVGMLPGWKRVKPYVYSDAEIDALLTAALALPPADGLRRWTYHTLFGLIAAIGMRISEAMGLERDDVDLDAGVLTVRLTKFGKSRLVPLHPTTRTALRDYAHRRDALLGSRCGSTFFVAEQGADCCTSTFIASSGNCPERSGCGAQVIVPGHACTTSVIASPSGRCSIGIAKAKTSSNNSQCSPLTSATPACAIPTGISQPAPS